LNNVDAYVDAVIKEIQIRSGQTPWSSSVFRTIYLGGGTPSVLSAEQTLSILSALNSSLSTEGSWAEATIEVNPEDVSVESLQGWLRCGIDRISIGAQSFDDEQLQWMNRKHSAKEAITAIQLARSEGFKKISIDLIYGLAHRSEGSWEKTIEKAFSLPIDHISCYALTVEPRTVLGARVKKGLEKEAPDELIEKDYSELCAFTKENGFLHYEVSNWAKDVNNKAIHNTSYWEGVPYLGLGPGAHGFDGENRYSLVSNNNKYIQEIGLGSLPEQIEKLSSLDRSNEILMTGLRTSKGVDFNELKRIWGVDHIAENLVAWERWVKVGAIVPSKEGRYRISEKFWLVGDSISADLISVQS
jgi:oxygen-independent coproporphyrinogen-3 oxidase